MIAFFASFLCAARASSGSVFTLRSKVSLFAKQMASSNENGFGRRSIASTRELARSTAGAAENQRKTQPKSPLWAVEVSSMMDHLSVGGKPGGHWSGRGHTKRGLTIPLRDTLRCTGI